MGGSVINLLLAAIDHGITISYQTGSVKMSSPHPSDHPLSIEIRERRDEVKHFYSELESRLRKGQSWLINAEETLWGENGLPINSPKTLATFNKNLFRWDNLDRLVEPRRCPIGPEGCHPDSMVICRTCGDR
jgi:hypothetical protein